MPWRRTSPEDAYAPIADRFSEIAFSKQPCPVSFYLLPYLICCRTPKPAQFSVRSIKHCFPCCRRSSYCNLPATAIAATKGPAALSNGCRHHKDRNTMMINGNRKKAGFVSRRLQATTKTFIKKPPKTKKEIMK